MVQAATTAAVAASATVTGVQETRLTLHPWFRTETEARHDGLSVAGAPFPSVVGCVLRRIVY